MRTTKELLIILRDYIIKNGVTTGMCSIILNHLYADDIVSEKEMKTLYQYLEDNSPLEDSCLSYWFPLGEAQPRIDWLNEQINKL